MGNTDYIPLKGVMGFELWPAWRIDNHVVCTQSRRSCPLQVGECLVVVGLRTQLGGTRIRQRVFTLEQKERCRSTHLVQTLLAFELHFSVRSSFTSRKHSLAR